MQVRILNNQERLTMNDYSKASMKKKEVNWKDGEISTSKDGSYHDCYYFGL